MKGHIVKYSETMTDLFCMEEKREDKTSSELFDKVIRSVNHVRRRGELRLSFKGLKAPIAVALFCEEQIDTAIKRYGTLDLTYDQIIDMKEEDELQDKGITGTHRMIKWVADRAPRMGTHLAMLRHNEQTNTGHRWEPWHMEQLQAIMELLNMDIKFIKTQEDADLEDLVWGR